MASHGNGSPGPGSFCLCASLLSSKFPQEGRRGPPGVVYAVSYRTVRIPDPSPPAHDVATVFLPGSRVLTRRILICHLIPPSASRGLLLEPGRAGRAARCQSPLLRLMPSPGREPKCVPSHGTRALQDSIICPPGRDKKTSRAQHDPHSEPAPAQKNVRLPPSPRFRNGQLKKKSQKKKPKLIGPDP